jgi:hypothetical protein
MPDRISIAAQLRQFGYRNEPREALQRAVKALGEGLAALELWGETQPQFHHVGRDWQKMRGAHASLKSILENIDA